MTYTYTIFDANPNSSSGTAWPTHQDIEIEADSGEAAIEQVRDVMSIEAAGLNPDDGYDVGQRLYAIVWDDDTVIVGEPTYELTAEDLGVEVATRYAIQGLVNGAWSREHVGSDDPSTLFASRAEADAALPDLAASLGCSTDELRVVEAVS